MENIKITFLGTGNAVPTPQRNHTSILIEWKNECFLVDCGEGTQTQLRKAKISAHKISHIFITHWHGDHILGLPGLFQTLAMENRTKPLHLYGPKGTKHYASVIEALLNKYRIPLHIHEISPGIILNSSDFQVEAKAMNHDIPSLAYSFTIKDKLRLNKIKLKKFKLPNSSILGQLQKGKDIIYKNRKIKASQVTYLEKGKKVAVILDTAYTSEAVSLAKNSDLAIIESSFSKEESSKAKEYKHLTAEDAAKIAKLAKVKSLFLTHISQRYESKLAIIEREAKKIFKNTKIAKDLEKVLV